MSKPEQLSLTSAAAPSHLGHTTIEYVRTKSILTRASGFMADYDFTLNPYSGCGFGCTYCYAAFFSRTTDQRDTWGTWVQVKENALAVLARMRTRLEGKSIYMSSVTDPYQPIERRLELVRDLLRELVTRRPHLVVQTRSPLVTRDLDLLMQFPRLRINVTVTTDSERVRKAFEPLCPNNNVRLRAVAELARAGVDVGVTLTPLLPVEDSRAFAQRLRESGARRFVVQPMHVERGRFVSGTREEAVKLAREMAWTPDSYREVVRVLHDELPGLTEGREGFAPPA